MLRTASVRLATMLLAAALMLLPSLLHAQKALVYCPVGIDATGCNAIVAALAADATRFPDGADAGYDGTQGTVDLAAADFSAYAVFVVPSLADGPDTQPYALLRNGTIAGRLQAAFVGRVAVWSGTPDVGSTNRSAKDGLIRNLAGWARADAAGTHGPGVVALQDNSDDAAGRYGWLGAISTLSVSGDMTFDVYSNVQALTSTGQTILTNGGLQLAYTNMASYGLVAGPGGRNDATGGRSSRVVLVTAAGETGESSIATVSTDREDYSPGETVVVTGGGWEPGETVSLLFHEDVDPQIHPDRTLTAVADGNGQILNQEYVIDEEDVGIQFILTATGLTSGRTAQTTFTDGNKLQFNTGPFSVAFNVCSPAITVQMFQGNNPDNGAPTPVTLSSSSAGGTFYSNATCTTAVTSVTIPTSASTATFFYKDANIGSPVITAVAGVGCNGNNCTVPQTETITGPDLTIAKIHAGNFTVGTPASYSITVTNSGTAATSGTVTVTDVQPAGLTFTGASGTGWTCGGTTTITCTRANALAAGASYPAITLNATPATAGTVTNVATVSGGGEANTGNNTASDPTTVVGQVDLTIDKSHTGNFTEGGNGTYTLAVSNSGSAATNANVTVTDVLPAGLGFVSGTGTGWNACTAAAQTVTCVRPAANTIAAGGAAPAITLTVSVAAAAVPSVTNTASVSGGGEPGANNGNNSDSDPTTVIAANQPPVVDAGGPYSGNEGSAIALNQATATDADAGDTPTYKWTYVANGAVDAGTTCSFSDDAVVQPTFTCNDDGAFTLTLTVNDGHGHIVPDNAGVTVANVKPTATAGGPYSGDESSAIQLAGSATDVGANDAVTYKWTADVTGIDPGGACAFDDDTKTDAQVTCTDDGTFKVKLVATDDDGAASIASEATLTVANVDPVADAGGPYDGNEGAAIQLNGAATDAGSNDTHEWSWQYVSGPAVDAGATCTFTDATAEDPKVTCTDDGAVKLTLTVTDDNGGTDTDEATLTLANVAPVAHANGPYTGDEGSAIQLNGSATDAGTNDVIGYKWTANVSGLDTGGACSFDDDTKKDAKVTCTDDGTVTLTLEAKDDDGGSDTDTATLTLANTNPVASAGGSYTGNEGSAVQLNGSVTDAGGNDTHQWSWQYIAGPGVDAGATCTFTDATAEDPKVTCSDDGEVKLTLTATDDDGGSGTDEAILTLSNVAPVAHANGPYTGTEGGPVQLNGSATDVGSNDTFEYKWTVNASSIDAGGACTFDDDTKKDAKVACTDDGAFTLTLTVTDDDGDTGSEQAALTVQNVKPTIAAMTLPDGSPLPTTIVIAGTLNIKVPFSDPASNDTHKAQIDCGSGYVNVNGAADVLSGFLTSCTFATVGTKTIKVKVTDDDGAFDEKSHTLTVKYNFIGFSAPVDRPTTMNVSKAGQAIPLKWRLTDANGAPVTNLTLVDIKISSLSCGGNVPSDLIEEYASGASGLKNQGDGNYQFNWKTPTNYAGSCKNIGLDFGSGYVEVALANFNFKS